MSDSRPLKGVRIVEFGGIGPGPYCARLFAEWGASVTRIVRDAQRDVMPMLPEHVPIERVSLDLKSASGVQSAMDLVAVADGVIEGFRPGVMERLGLGPEDAFARNRALIYGRMTGWGQTGPFADRAGHDINYIALSGVLNGIGPAERPIPPWNLVGDFGGGAMFLVAGMLGAMLNARASGQGAVVDCAMTEGAASLASFAYGLHAEGRWSDKRQSNYLDGSSPYYRAYETRDGKWMAVGAIEEKFYAALLAGLELSSDSLPDRANKSNWPRLVAILEAAFRERTREDWEKVFSERDACCTPILSLAEAPHHPQNVARGAFVEVNGAAHPGSAPRFAFHVAPAAFG